MTEEAIDTEIKTDAEKSLMFTLQYALSKIESLSEKFNIYGQHRANCPLPNLGSECVCGFTLSMSQSSRGANDVTEFLTVVHGAIKSGKFANCKTTNEEFEIISGLFGDIEQPGK